MTVGAGLVVVVDLGVAGSAGLGDICLEGRAGRVLVAEDAVRSVATLAVGCDEKAFLAEREAVDRVHVVRIDAGQALFGRHGAVTVALAAGFWHVERIDGRAGIGLGEDLVRVAVAAGAGMLPGRGVHAARQLGSFIGMAGFAVDLRDVIGMRVLLDVGVTVIALQTAVNAGTELVSIDRDAVPGCVLHGLVGMAGQTVGLRSQAMGRQEKRECDKAECDRSMMPNDSEEGG